MIKVEIDKDEVKEFEVSADIAVDALIEMAMINAILLKKISVNKYTFDIFKEHVAILLKELEYEEVKSDEEIKA